MRQAEVPSSSMSAGPSCTADTVGALASLVALPTGICPRAGADALDEILERAWFGDHPPAD